MTRPDLENLTPWVLSVLLFSLRITPVFALAPPFTLTRTPAIFRVLFGIGLAAVVLSGRADQLLARTDLAAIVPALARELFLGATFVLALQTMFGALQVAGRTIDIQAGFGLALLLDPSSQAQTPLIGTLLAYGAGLVFFTFGGHLELLRILMGSLDRVPLGAGFSPMTIQPLLTFVSGVILAAFGVAGGAILMLFLADLAIAWMSRTMPQMNVLILGFQIKPILTLLALPLAFGAGGALLARMARITLEAIPGLL